MSTVPPAYFGEIIETKIYAFNVAGYKTGFALGRALYGVGSTAWIAGLRALLKERCFLR